MNELPNTFANKLSLAAFKLKKATGKHYSKMAEEIGISRSLFQKMMKGDTTPKKKIIATALANYFAGELTMQDMGYE